MGASCVDQTILAKEKAVLAFFNQCLGLYPHVMQARGHSCACQASFIILSGSRKFRLAWSVFLGMVVRRSVLARAIGLVGHILEEMKNPMAYEIKQRAEEEATAHLRG